DITWWENIGGAGTVWVEHTVDGAFNGAWSVYAADIDGDGNMDVLGAAFADHDITWWNRFGYNEGMLESSIMDAGLVDTWDVFFCNSQEPAGASVAFQLRSSSDAGDMGSWSDTLFAPGAGLSGILAPSTQYLQYRVILDTADPLSTPVLEDVMFSYSVYVGTEENSSGDITSWALLPPENPSYGHYSAMITVPEPGMVELALYDVSGRVVAESSQEFSMGTHSVIFGGLAEGVYFCTMRAGEYTATEKVVVLE
ncbi:MAG: T9SS type A sorting domain-containing protein, partial [Candidatus Sabulitectum sp.]|nr:T9SS type A sorting domain-containing protein [Candidatus Sabulitectum sp.]